MSTTSAPAGPVARHRTTVLWVVAVLVVLVVLAVVTRDHATHDGPLDPRNPKSSGAQALARVLDRHGVEVTVVRGQAELLQQPRPDADTSVVVTNPQALGPSTERTLRTRAASAGAVVLVGDAQVLGALVDLDTGFVPRGVRHAACDVHLARGLVVRAYGGEGVRAEGCFGRGGTSLLAERDSVWMLASPSSISNRHVLEEDNAALGLRLLGQHPRLVWYVADATDLTAGEGFSLARLLPPWLAPSLLLLVVAVLALMLWRGRRLGPLVTEPLPVVVRAVESTQARGRIYRRTNDRTHASQILLGATRRRLTESLGLPPRTRLEAVADAAAARTGRDPVAVRDLLATAPRSVTTNARLADLGARLAQLENEVTAP